MNILQEILKSQGGNLVGQLANQFGVNASDAEKALSNLIPAIAGGVKKTARTQSGLDGLLSTLDRNRDLDGAIDQPDILGRPESTQAGNEILGNIFGSKDISRTVADQTAKSTGLDFGMLKKMLPVIAGLVMASLNKQGQASGGGLGGLLGSLVGGGQQQRRSSGLGGLFSSLLGRSNNRQAQSTSGGLGPLLDFDGDGSVSDDMLKLIVKLF